jgi:pimeloyl-ACP methyl ester carboxylesterase
MALVLGVAGAGCTSSRGQADALAQRAGLERLVLHGGPFRHLAYYRAGEDGGGPLHVYIDHDGRPWQGRRVSADPSPRDPLALRLMVQDRAAALYLGRPCHYALDRRPPCSPWLWTHARYGDEVVSGLVQAIDGFLRERPYDALVLIGYSGGGTLAVLLAERLPRTAAIVTVAANLDVGGWAALHGYSPLSGSHDPVVRAPLPASVEQVHYAGSADRNVPPALLRGYARRHPAARVVEIAGFDHVCCWVSAWPAVLDRPPFR